MEGKEKKKKESDAEKALPNTCFSFHNVTKRNCSQNNKQSRDEEERPPSVGSNTNLMECCHSFELKAYETTSWSWLPPRQSNPSCMPLAMFRFGLALSPLCDTTFEGGTQGEGGAKSNKQHFPIIAIEGSTMPEGTARPNNPLSCRLRTKRFAFFVSRFVLCSFRLNKGEYRIE